MKEKWRRVMKGKVRLPYMVSSLGRVRRVRSHRILRAGMHPQGYQHVCLYWIVNNIQHKWTVRIARLVVQAFKPPRPLGWQIHHRYSKLDNRVSALEFVPMSINIRNSYATGQRRKSKHSNHQNNRIYKSIFQLHRAGISERQISRIVQITISAVSRILNGLVQGALEYRKAS